MCGPDSFLLRVYLSLSCAACPGPSDLGFWWIWINLTLLMRLDSPYPSRLWAWACVYADFVLSYALLLFPNTIFLFLWSKLLGKFYKFLYMFLLIVVMFLCILFTENLDEKYYCIFLALFPWLFENSWKFCPIPFQILDNCLWYMLYDFVGLLLLFVFDINTWEWILIGYLVYKLLV